MATAPVLGRMLPVIQNFVGPIFVAVIPTSVVRHPAGTANHKPPKKAIAHGFILNMARTRKKKRRDVNGMAMQNSTARAF